MTTDNTNTTDSTEPAKPAGFAESEKPAEVKEPATSAVLKEPVKSEPTEQVAAEQEDVDASTVTTTNAETSNTETPAARDAATEPVTVDTAISDTFMISKINPLSALKVGVGFGVCLFIVWMVAVTIIWMLLGVAGVWERLEDLLVDLLGLDSLNPAIYFGTAGALGLFEMIIFVLLAPLVAIVYNAGEQFFGGLKINLKNVKR